MTGLDHVQVGEMVEFVDSGLTGMALNLEAEQVGCIFLEMIILFNKMTLYVL